jgi:hypothetical protein
MAAFHDQASAGNNAILSLPVAQMGVLLDPVQRHFSGVFKHSKNRVFSAHTNGIVAPFASGDHAPISRQNDIEFPAVEHNLAPATRFIARVIVPWPRALAATELDYGFVSHLLPEVLTRQNRFASPISTCGT